MKKEINWEEVSQKEIVKKYPRIISHIIATSLGYATPSGAAEILRDAKLRRKNCCEWILTCYKGNPLPVVKECISFRHCHKGYMSDFAQAFALVREAIRGREPIFSSWF